MRRRRVLGGVAATVVVAGVATASVAVARMDRDDASSSTEVTVPPSFTSAERRDLTRRTDLDGVVGHGETSPFPLVASGTLTGLPEVGDVVDPGEPVAEVDGSPVLLLVGERPAWRALGAGLDDGADVVQLETALVQLGIATADELEVDAEWDADTTAAVKRLQRWFGMPVDGRLDLGEVVFRPGSVRVASVGGHVGAPASAAELTVSGLEQFVTTDLDADDDGLLAPGDAVTLELPSGDERTATVASVGRPVVAGDGSATIPVTIDAGDLDLDDGVPVEIHVDVVDVADALAVPTDALLAVAEGGYAVEVADPSAPGGTRLVGVDLGVFADGWVQVDGELEVGDRVVVP